MFKIRAGNCRLAVYVMIAVPFQAVILEFICCLTVNTRGLIFTHKTGIVLRSAYHVFDMYVNELGDTVLDTFGSDMPVLNVRDKEGKSTETAALDVLATLDARGNVVIAAVNKDPACNRSLRIIWQDEKPRRYTVRTLAGKSPDSYNDIDKNEVIPGEILNRDYKMEDEISLSPHSVSILKFS